MFFFFHNQLHSDVHRNTGENIYRYIWFVTTSIYKHASGQKISQTWWIMSIWILWKSFFWLSYILSMRSSNVEFQEPPMSIYRPDKAAAPNTPPSQHRINTKSLRFCCYRRHAVWQEWLIVFYSVCCANFSAVVYLEGQSVRSVWVLGTGSVQAYGNFDKTHIWNVTLSNSFTVTKSASKKGG